MGYYFTSESVSEGHPDKVADQISDAVLDAILSNDPSSKVACETLVTTRLVVVADKIRTTVYIEVPDVAHHVIDRIGYNKSEYQFDAQSCGVMSALHGQSNNFFMGVGHEDSENHGAGGQAMMHDPQVLILDEPTSGLDPNQLIDIRNLISSLGKEKTVLLSTHIMQEVEAICERAIIINKGVVVADDKIENLKQENSASNVVVVEFESEVDETLLRGIPQVGRVQRIKGNHWILEPQGDTDIRANLMKWSVDRGLIIKTLQKEDLSIEEAFQKLTLG